MQRRHFLETAKNANYSIQRAEQILDEMLEKVDLVIEETSAILPDNFPSKIVEPIFKGILLAKHKLTKSSHYNL